MNYPQSGLNLGPAAEQITMIESVRVLANADYVKVLIGGLFDEDLAVLRFPVWESPEQDQCEPMDYMDSEPCVICGDPVPSGELYCRECGP